MFEESATYDQVELTQQTYEAFSRREFDVLARFFAADVVVNFSELGLGIFEGAQAARWLFEHWWAPYTDFSADAEDTLDLGQGGKIESITTHLDPDEARAAAERLAEERR